MKKQYGLLSILLIFSILFGGCTTAQTNYSDVSTANSNLTTKETTSVTVFKSTTSSIFHEDSTKDTESEFATSFFESTTEITEYSSRTTRTRTTTTTSKTTTTTEAEYNYNESNSQTVYITNTGTKYHRDGCQYLRKSQIPISLSDAKAQGYTPCSRCFK